MELEYEDRPCEIPYTPPTGELTANQFLNPDSQAIDTDADFWLAGWVLTEYTGPFQVQLQDSSGYNIQSGMINSAALSTSLSDPSIFTPPRRFPAGSKISIIIQDLSGATNPLQITFKGWKRFAMRKGA
jgi:hypothetical protein